MRRDLHYCWRLNSKRGQRRPDTARPRQHPARPMVATSTFTTSYQGQVEQVQAGRDFVDSTHLIALRNPDRFRPAPSSRRFELRDLGDLLAHLIRKGER